MENRKHDMDWKNAVTFEEYVYFLFEDKRLQTPEFQILIQIYGRAKLEKLWKEFKKKKAPA